MEHKFDAVGVCSYCDLCDDFTCCSETELECSRWKLEQIGRMRKSLHSDFMKERLRK